MQAIMPDFNSIVVDASRHRNRLVYTDQQLELLANAKNWFMASLMYCYMSSIRKADYWKSTARSLHWLCYCGKKQTITFYFLQTDVVQWVKDSNFIILTILSSRLGCELDNVARIWRVHYDTKAILSAITTIIHVFPFHQCNIQFYLELSPRYWLYIKENFYFTWELVLSLFSACLSNFSYTSGKFHQWTVIPHS